MQSPLRALRGICSLLFLCGACVLPGAQTPPDPYGKIVKDVAYSPASPADALDLYYPAKGTPPYPTHVYIHGGGWTGGGKRLGGLTARVFQRLAEEGFLGVSVDYRLVNAKDKTYVRDCALDCMDALRYLFAHAKELGVDPTRVFVWGGSAGGHLALLCAVVPADALPGAVPAPAGGTPVKAVVAWYPPADMPNYEDISVQFNHTLRPLSNRMGCTPSENPARYAEISPLDRLTRNAPPVLIFHGDGDSVVNIEHSRRFAEKAKTLGVPCELVVVKNASHGFSPVAKGAPISPDTAVITAQTAQWFVDRAATKPAATAPQK